MNIDLVGKVQPLYVDTDGRLHYADCGTIYENWAEILVTLKNGDSFSMVRDASFSRSKEKSLLVVDVEYQFKVHFSVGMCCRSGRNMSILTASVADYERYEMPSRVTISRCHDKR